ncbi:MAG: aminoacetone oxidase family FAD-binding enzyme [Lachnospiraceae bacterium]|nr:aminoacetone oxidase family FAD-binding enzyme [Lachnospiraceae bacterium]
MNIAVIGGGASGMTAAIAARYAGAEVTIFEHMPRMGKKLLLTGSGKCNISNADMDLSHFHGGDGSVIKSVLERCTHYVTRRFFEGLGLIYKDRGGYYYPYCEQASAVVDVLRFAIRDMGIEVHTDIDIRSIDTLQPIKEDSKKGFVIMTNEGRYVFDKVILCCGSSSNRNTGSDGSGYILAKKLGHSVIKPLPALTYLTCEEGFYPSIAGIRTRAGISLMLYDDDGTEELLGSEMGELQLTKRGISGIPVFNLSRLAIKAADEGKSVKARIDFLPEVMPEDMIDFLKDRFASLSGRKAEEAFIGLFAKPLGICFLKRCGINLQMLAGDMKDSDLIKLADTIKSFETFISGSGDFEAAQTVQGGVSLSEVTPNLESRIVPGLYFAGEILDVDGDCGGYNLQWAVSSGMAAGREAAG